MYKLMISRFFFFFNDTATTEIYTLSLHDALPISTPHPSSPAHLSTLTTRLGADWRRHLAQYSLTLYNWALDRKSTRLNSSHSQISYAVFCLKKKKNTTCVLL